MTITPCSHPVDPGGETKSFREKSPDTVDPRQPGTESRRKCWTQVSTPTFLSQFPRAQHAKDIYKEEQCPEDVWCSAKGVPAEALQQPAAPTCVCLLPMPSHGLHLARIHIVTTGSHMPHPALPAAQCYDPP